MALDDNDEEATDRVRAEMDSVWYELLSPEDRMVLNARGRVDPIDDALTVTATKRGRSILTSHERVVLRNVREEIPLDRARDWMVVVGLIKMGLIEKRIADSGQLEIAGLTPDGVLASIS